MEKILREKLWNSGTSFKAVSHGLDRPEGDSFVYGGGNNGPLFLGKVAFSEVKGICSLLFCRSHPKNIGWRPNKPL